MTLDSGVTVQTLVGNYEEGELLTQGIGGAPHDGLVRASVFAGNDLCPLIVGQLSC